MATTYDCQINKRALIDLLGVELKAHHIDISGMVLERFNFILGNTDLSQEQSKVIHTLFVQPMLVTDTDLGKILRLKAPQMGSSLNQSLAPREHAFYIRSWSMTPTQLYNISQYLQDDGKTFPELDEWKFTSFVARTRDITVRYVGSTNCVTTASRRFADDTNNKSKKSLLGAFQCCLEEKYPLISQKAKIHLLPDMSFDILGSGNHIGNQLNADDTESLLIHLLGSRSLLNLQLGGHHIRYLPSEEDEMIFENLDTSYFQKILSENSLFSNSEWSSVKNHFAKMLTGDPRLNEAVSKTAKDALESQARPYQYLGTTIVVFIGEELTDSHLKARCSFFDGKSKSSRLVRNLIYRIKHIEEKNYIGDNVVPLQDISRAFPFLNVIPLPKYSATVKALDFLSAYFRCTRPIIVVTFGKVAASAMIFNLTKISAKSRLIKSFLTLGTHPLEIRSYDSDDNEAFIHIPLEHPGSHQYGPRSSVRLRFYYLTMQFAFFVASCAIEIVDTYPKCTKTPSRRELCTQILAHVEKALKSGAGSYFQSNMIQARKAAQAVENSDTHFQTDLFEYLYMRSSNWHESKLAQTALCDSTARIHNSIGAVATGPLDFYTPAIFGKKNGIEILDEHTFSHIASFGMSVGEAYSEKRRRDLDMVWARAQKELHWSIPHSEDKRNIWMEQFASLQPGQPYLLRALSQLTDGDYLKVLIETCPKKRWYPTLPIEKYEKGVLSEGVVKCGFWLQKKNVRKSSTLFPSRFLTAKEMQGYPIAIKEDGAFLLRWKHPDGSNKTLSLCARFAIPKGNRDSRALSFTEHGIDIVDASGRSLRSSNLWSEGISKASIPRSELHSRPSGRLLVDLWTTARQDCGHSVAKEEIDGISKKWGAPGQKYLASNATKQQMLRQNCPPRENDANFLLVAFLDERFPDGGTLRTAPKAKVGDSTEDLQAFVQFCKRSEFSRHPYSSTWIGLLDRDAPLVGLLGKNIQIYRACQVSGNYNLESHD
ncbi:hypothetical protein PENSUB_11812 [Penicillium subrubescens]|uniref:Uncharacterized protein n=1 Tax=Penicillium subrubescens TaxID=1316194 RepID=A0A1Q5T331_9EURO|nr:hypothetical protein PENSUB_11812 [Penicillium subrubescens]